MRRLALLFLPALLLAIAGCRPPDARLPPEEQVEVPTGGEVVVFVETPRTLTAPILKMITDRTGIAVRATWREDDPGTFVDKLRTETAAGRADLFFGNGALTAVALARDGLGVPFRPERARPIPPQYRDRGFRYLGYAADPRVILYNRDAMSRDTAPESIENLVTGPWAGKAAIARPTDGGSAFQAAALISRLGDERGLALYRGIAAAGNRLVDNDGEVRKLVASGECAWGVINFDQAYLAGREAEPTTLRIPDGMGYGTVVVPHVAMLLRGGPNPQQARGVVDRLFGGNVVKMLGESDNALVSLMPIVAMGFKKPEFVPLLGALNVLPVDNEAVYDAWVKHRQFLTTLGSPPTPP
ncbi:MAG TPA: ABC transporter substrate-binding protein [Candidatus Polarisedimenticolia bacterium]|nr:ABC transporter substrate-binding protein [Candidatus Polarisedimenticolia bacterium]